MLKKVNILIFRNLEICKSGFGLLNSLVSLASTPNNNGKPYI